MSTPYTNPWTEHNIKRLKECHAAGMSASGIASIIGGVTRNAVIGKLHRLGIHKPRTLTKEEKRHHSRRAKGWRKTIAKAPYAKRTTERGLPIQWGSQAQPLPPRRDDVIATKTFAEINQNDCRYIPNEATGNGPVYCGQPTVEGLSYCERCAQFCFTASPPRRREQSDPARPYTPASKFREFA